MTNSKSRVTGTVIHGKGRGTGLGFPTANLKLDNPSQRPPKGIYAAYTHIKNPTSAPGAEVGYPAAVHVGPGPTFNQETPTVEVHLLYFLYQELYDQRLEVQFVERIADIKKFDSIEELKVRIQQNCDRVRQLLTAS